MQDSQKSTSRKKFLLWTATALSSLTVLKLMPGKKKKKEEEKTVRMLTQDGKLVEINKDLVIRSARKISDKELQQWIKTKPAQL